MKARISFVCFILSLCFTALEARTLVFTYTTPGAITFYNNHPVLFSINRDFQRKAQNKVVGLNQTTTITLTDDGGSVFRPYLLNIYVPPFTGQPLPYPIFFPNPGPGTVTVSVDGAQPSGVFMVIDPFDGLMPGPMAVGFIF